METVQQRRHRLKKRSERRHKPHQRPPQTERVSVAQMMKRTALRGLLQQKLKDPSGPHGWD